MRISRPSRTRILLLAAIGAFILLGVGCSGRGANQKSISSGAVSAENPSPAHRGPITLRPGEATTSPPPDSGEAGAVAALDVAGVRLGMTPEQVILELKGFDPGLVQSKRYATATNSSQLSYGSPTGLDECTVKDPFRLFVGISAAKGTTFLGGRMQERIMAAGTELAGCGDDSRIQPGDEAETVTAYLGPEPGNHRVIAVSLWKSFKTPSTVDAVMDGALKKYPADLTAQQEESTVKYGFWRFDSRGRVMSADTAKRQNLLNTRISAFGPARALPAAVYEGLGVGIDLVINTDFKNQQIAKEFRISLYDEDALYKFTRQARAMYDAFHEKELKEETDKAKKSASPVKM